MLFDEILLLANLHMAWQRVRQNKGCAGIDDITLIIREGYCFNFSPNSDMIYLYTVNYRRPI